MKGIFANVRVMITVFIVLLLLAMSAQALPGSPPVIDSIGIDPENPADYSDLTCRVSLSDPDGDMDYVDFRWYLNGVLRKESTQLVYGSGDTASDTLNALYTKENDYVVCQARAYDFEGGYAFASHAVRVGSTPANSMPTISYVDITPRHPNPQQDLTCSVLATDADDNLDYVTFRWQRNGIQVRTATKGMEGSSDLETDTLGSAYTSPGDRVSCLASVYDTDGASDSGYSSPVLVSGEQPYPPYPPYPPQPPYNNKPLAILTANKYYAETGEMVYFSGSKSHDPDGFVLQYKFDYGDGEQSAWLPNTSPYSYHSYSEDGSYYAMVKVKDNRYLESEWSNPVLIRVGHEGYAYGGYGHSPEIEDIDIYVKQRAGYLEFRCEVNVYDRDDDLDYVRFKWYVDGGLFSTDKEYVSGDEDEADSRMNLAFEDEDDYYNVKCTATVYDEERNYDTASRTVRGYPPEGEECEITVSRFDYNSYLTEGQKGWVEIEIENTGERPGTLRIELYVDGSLKNSYETYLSREEEVEKRFEFPLSVGNHNVRVESYLPCGGRVAKFTEMTVFSSSSQVFIPQEEEEEEGITETSVTISPKSIDVEVNTGKTLEIFMEVPGVSEFSISVEGIPEDWTNYPGEVEVEGKEKVYVYMVPKVVGSYEFTVKVKTEGRTFEEDIELYVSPEGGEGEEANGITGLITFAEGNWLIGLAIVSVLVLIVAIYLFSGRFRRKTYEDQVYGPYPPRMMKGSMGNPGGDVQNGDEGIPGEPMRYSDGTRYPKYGGDF